MNAIISGLLIVGMLINAVGAIMILVAAFKVSTGWGLGCIFIPFVSLVFLFTHWEECKPGLKVEVMGLSFVLLGAVLVFRVGFSNATLVFGDLMDASLDSLNVEEAEDVEAFVSKLREQAEISHDHQNTDPDQTRRDDVSGPHKYVGMSVDEAKQLLGKPRGELITGKRVVLDYPQVQLISEDGKTINMEKLRRP